MMPRRTKIIIAVVSVLLLIALGVFWYFLRGKQPTVPSNLSGTFPPPSDEITPPGEEPPTVLPEEAPVAFEPILRQLSKVPVAGAVLGSKSGQPIVRYQERATGNIYEIGAAGEGEKRLTNTTIPKVYEALWSKTGTELVSRYIREGGEIVESFSSRVVLGSSGTEGELQGAFLPRDILSAAMAPDGKRLFYLQEENGGASGVQSDLSGDEKIKLWSSPVSEWLVSWPKADRIALLSKPSGLASGMLLSLNPATGGSALVLRNLPGLTALMNPVKPSVLYGASSESSISLHLLDTATGRQSIVSPTTFPEKCVWSKNGELFYCGVPKIIPTGTYPDVWYQGIIAFEDEVWSIAPSSGTIERVLDISEKRGSPIDLINPEVSPDEKFLIFTDKESGTLWSLQMKE